MKPVIFIDGEAGTTGLQILTRLQGRTDIELIRLQDMERKDKRKREEALNDCDLAILCLPDDAAREAVSLVNSARVRILDASSAHRTQPDWIYGLPEMGGRQVELIAGARRVTNPGCYPAGAVSLLRPLVRKQLLPAEYPFNINAISGYSGAGKDLINAYENRGSTAYTETPFQWYAVKLQHKHIEEIRVHACLEHRPIFTPGYGGYRQGIVLQIPVHLWNFSKKITGQDLYQALVEHYKESTYVHVVPEAELASINKIEPETLNGTNDMRIYVFYDSKYRQAILAAVYDNLGKGASGAAVQNMNIMLGLSQLGNLDLSKKRDAGNQMSIAAVGS